MSESKKIWLFVAFLHIVGLALISTASEMKPEKKRMIVVTKQSAPAPALTPHTIVPIIATPKKMQATPVKKTHLPVPKKVNKSSKQVLKKLDKRLVKPYTPPPTPPPPTLVPDTTALHYVDYACSVFRDQLVLPEKGVVKLTITVQPNGKIGRVEIETFESTKNLDYLMTMLPTLSLPTPEGGKDATFTVLFCNDLPPS